MKNDGEGIYLHCAQCLRELPVGLSPEEWARTQTFITMDEYVVVTCTRHNREVVRFKVPSTVWEEIGLEHKSCAQCGKH